MIGKHGSDRRTVSASGGSRYDCAHGAGTDSALAGAAGVAPLRVLFVHPSFPGQFGHIARYLADEAGWECTFASTAEPHEGERCIRKIRYRPDEKVAKSKHFLTQDFQDEVSHAAGLHEALKSVGASVRPDLIVGYTGSGSGLFLRELFPETPIIGYVEYFFHPHGSAIDFRPDFPPDERAVLRHVLRNAGLMLQLEDCTAGYTPTRFQHGLLPEPYRSKVRVIHDGIETAFWKRITRPSGSGDRQRIVTYAARGLEAMRGFDLFMRVARRIQEEYPNVAFLVAGSDVVQYGSDEAHISEDTFKEHVLAHDDFDLERFRFLGWIPRGDLLQILNLSDLHIYLTVPFVLSWSLLNAMSCGCTILASDTEPVREVIRPGENGLLRDFFDVEGLAEAAVRVLEDPEAHRALGSAARQTVLDRYSLDVVMPEMLSFYREIASAGTA